MYTTKQAYGIDHDRQSDAEGYLVEAIRHYGQKCEDVRSRNESVKSVTRHIDEYLEAEYQLNSLGELQSRGQDLDRAITERHDAGQQVVKFAWQLVHVNALSQERMDHILDQTPFARSDEQKAQS